MLPKACNPKAAEGPTEKVPLRHFTEPQPETNDKVTAEIRRISAQLACHEQ